MKMNDNNPENLSSQSWMRYAGMTAQMLATLALGIWLGSWLDGKTNIRFPIFSLGLPVLLLVGLLWKLIQETAPSKKKNRH